MRSIGYQIGVELPKRAEQVHQGRLIEMISERSVMDSLYLKDGKRTVRNLLCIALEQFYIIRRLLAPGLDIIEYRCPSRSNLWICDFAWKSSKD